MGNKKRQRSESFQAGQGGNGNARKRLAAFHARMFELPQEDSPTVAPETPRVLLKAKHKKKIVGIDTDDGEAVPMVKFNMIKNKKEKKKKKVETAVKDEKKKKKTVMGPAVVKTPGMSKSNGIKEKKMAQMAKNQVQKQQNFAIPMVKKTRQMQTVTVQTPQWHSMQTVDAGDDGVNLLEQAIGSMKEIVTGQGAKSLHKKHKTVVEKTVAGPKMEKLKENVEAAEEKDVVIQTVEDDISDNEPSKKRTKKQKKRKKKMRKQVAEEAKDSKLAPDDLAVNVDEDKTNLSAACKQMGATARENDSTAITSTASLPKSRTKRKKSSKVSTTSSVLPKTQAPAQLRQDKLVVSDKPEKLLVSDAAKHANKSAPKKAKRAPGKKAEIGSKPAVPLSAKAVSSDEKNAAMSSKPLTPIAASLIEAAEKKNDMFLSTQEETPRRSPAPVKRKEKAAVPQVTDEVSSESEDDGGDNTSLFSRLIDSAAREQWELVEVGRLVRLFAAEWDFKESKTARFLCETCPELVNVDFLEGLGVNLSAKRLVQVFEAGSGNSGVLINKMASALENGHFSVRDPIFVSALERRVALMESNAEVMELLHPLLESLSTVRDVGCLLKQLCEHWQLERKIALVQQVLLSNVFDDLDGNQDEILLDLPDLTGRLDFPSRLDQEDIDENGNLKGFLVNDDSDFSGEEMFEEAVDEIDSEDDEGPYEGDTDSEEEVEISGQSRSRNQFIEDEADVGDEDDDEVEEVEEEERHGSDASSSSDSD